MRGGASIDLDWVDGRAVKAVITALVPGRFVLKMPAGVSRAKVKAGGKVHEYTAKTFPVELRQGEVGEVFFSGL